MKKDLKKFLAISILLVGVLSSAPLAFCSTHSDNFSNRLQAKSQKAPCISDEELKKFFKIYEMLKNMNATAGGNPVMKVFEDRYPLYSDEEVYGRVNTFNGNIITLIYYPQSFNVKRFHTILELNGIKNDLHDTTTIEIIKDSTGKDVTALCGKEWARVIYPFDGINHRVEYISNYKDPINSISRKRIVFLFNPSIVIKENNGNIIEKYNKFLTDCGLGEFINIDLNDIKNLTVPFGVEKIDEHTFEKCKSSLQKVEILHSVKEIGESTFKGFESLKEVIIPKSIKKISKYAFSGCKSLKRVNIPASVKEIEKYAFNKCSSLETVNIPKGIKKIGENAFYGCEALKSIKIPDSVKSIESEAFMGCRSLKKVKIPNDVTEIGEFAFYACDNLEEIIIPDNVKKIGECAFYGCDSLKLITYNNNIYTKVDKFFEAFNKNNPSSESTLY